MDIEYKINLMTDVWDKHYRMVNALIDFLNKKDYPTIDKNDCFTIKKQIHTDGNGEHHFTFTHKGYSYHAYTDQAIAVINGKPMETRLRIKRITRLEIFY